MKMASFIPYLLSLAGLAFISAGGASENGGAGAAGASPTPQRIEAARIAPSDELSGVSAIPATPEAAQRLREGADPRPEAIRNLRVTHEINVNRWLQPGEFAWDEDAAAAARGPATVVVNLRARTLSVYRGGIEVGRSSILYGFGGHPTPTGTFPVLEKQADYWSRTYDAPMPHMLRLTRDGVALHGSPMLADDLGTHGCIGLPQEFAALLFTQVGVGDQVVVWSGRAEG
jgi:lipoprotein-anchoring transpeptidase ErfK/SrfK